MTKQEVKHALYIGQLDQPTAYHVIVCTYERGNDWRGRLSQALQPVLVAHPLAEPVPNSAAVVRCRACQTTFDSATHVEFAGPPYMLVGEATVEGREFQTRIGFYRQPTLRAVIAAVEERLACGLSQAFSGLSTNGAIEGLTIRLGTATEIDAEREYADDLAAVLAALKRDREQFWAALRQVHAARNNDLLFYACDAVKLGLSEVANVGDPSDRGELERQGLWPPTDAPDSQDD